MTVRRKTIGLIMGAIIAMVLVLNLTSQLVLGSSYGALEQENIRQDIHRALDSVSNKLTELESKNGDWANWDDAYAFARGDNPDFIAIATDTAFNQLKINFIIICQPSGQILFEKGYDLASASPIAVPSELHTYLADPATAQVLLQNEPEGSKLSGVLRLPEGPMLIAANSILTNDGRGPSAGTIIFGRYLDPFEIEQLAKITRMDLNAYSIDAADLPDDYRSALSTTDANTLVSTKVFDDSTIAAYGLLKDVFDQPAVLMRVAEPREIFLRGQESIRYFTLWMICIGIIFGVALQWIADRLFQSRQELEDSERRYHTVVEQAADAIFLLDPKTRQILEANVAFRDMLGYSPKEIAGLKIYDLVADDPENIARDFCEVAPGKIEHIGERQFRHQDRFRVDTDSKASAIIYDGRQVISVVVRDVTARKIADAERTKLLHMEQTRRAELDVLYNLSRELNVVSDSETVLNVATRKIVEIVSMTYAGIALVEGDYLRIRTVYPIRPIEDLSAVSSLPSIHRRTLASDLLEQTEPIILRRDEVGIDESGYRAFFFDSAQSVCLIALRDGERTLGVLILGEARSEQRERFTPEELRLASSIGNQVANALQRVELFEKLSQTYLQTVLALARAVESKDTYTADHAEDVSNMAVAVGEALGMSPRELEDLRYGAILHDIGKIGIADAILKKPTGLTKEEWMHIREHPTIGAEILAPIPHLAGAAEIIRHHHERFDGTGYPDGLSRNAIPLGARILTIVDSYSAIMDKRTYKDARSQDAAIAELKRCAGSQFDPNIVDVFLMILGDQVPSFQTKRDQLPVLEKQLPSPV